MSLPEFQFYDRRQYFAALTRAARDAKSGDRLTVMAMAFNPGYPEIMELMDALTAAAERGVKVWLSIDAHTLMIDGFKLGPLWHGNQIANDIPESFKPIYEQLQRLRLAGGQYRITNRPAKAHTNPYGGRSHMKLAIVNDLVFIGGCNLENPAHMDIMISWRDADTASWLQQLTEKAGASPTVHEALEGTDIEHIINDRMKLFVDAGIKKQSIILDQAHRLIDEAKEFVTITCQYFPGGATGQKLLAAHKRGVKVTIYFSPPLAHHGQAPAHWLYDNFERLRLPASFFKHRMPPGAPKMHAKILLTEKSALIGSHNYVGIGVNLGTAEIALQVDDPDFIHGTMQHVEKLLATNSFR